MNTKNGKIRVAINGYGVIGKRVADAVGLQPDLEVAGVSDISSDWRMQTALLKGFKLYASQKDQVGIMRRAGLDISGVIDDLLNDADIVVDCTPKGIGASNAKNYSRHGIKFIVQGGEKHDVTGHSFVADTSYEQAFGRASTRVVSCNTTSTVRTLTALKRAGLLSHARGTLLRRATDPWESHLGGIMNTLVPEPKIPSHQGPDAQTVDPDLDVITMAVKVPETLAHLHYWTVKLTREASKEEVLDAFRTSSRIALIRMDNGLNALNAVKELMADIGRPYDNLYEVALWEDMLSVQGDEAFYAYMVDNQAIVIADTIDAIRSLTASEKNGDASMKLTNRSLGIYRDFFSKAF